MFTWYQHIVYNPIANVYTFLLDSTGGIVVLATVVLVILIKLLLYSFSYSMYYNQQMLARVQPEIVTLQKKFADNKQELGIQIIDVYRKNRINPFIIIVILIIQIPLYLGIYFVLTDASTQGIDVTHLYSFVKNPETLVRSLGAIDLYVAGSFLLALFVGVTQWYATYVMQLHTPPSASETDFAITMKKNVLYVLPVVVAIISFFLHAVIALYWIVNNIATAIQYMLFKKKFSLLQTNRP
ncbi:MAG: membrane protein insertase YidC [Alphaproteobacteria bacterium]|nr:membrane protein insertase YidC [Alphaproteobacteria bacterium]